MKLDPLPKLEPPNRWIGVRPLGRERRLKLQITISANQRLIHVHVEGGNKTIAARVGIHRGGISIISPAKGLCLARRAERSQQQQREHGASANPT
jgi:hypothetical protein